MVIVTYNSAHVISSCLDPIYDHEFIEVIVYDNCSTDETVDLLHANYPLLKVVEGDVNLGFSKAVNNASSLSKSPFILLLNPDAIISAETISSLTRRFDSDSDVAIVAPLLVEEQGTSRVVSAGRAPNLSRMFAHSSGLSEFSDIFPVFEGHYLIRKSVGSETRDVDWVSGGCLMIRRSWWNTVGGLTERWFMYAEDVDLCIRVASSGGRIQLVPSQQAIHAVGGSSKGVDGRVNSAWIENLYDLYCWRISSGRTDSFIWKVIVCSGFVSRSIIYKLLALMSRSRTNDYTAESLRFRVFAISLWKRKYDSNW